MNKNKLVICAFALVLTLTSIQPLRADAPPPCRDGQVPIGSVTCTPRSASPVETKTNEDDSIFVRMLEWFNSFGF